MNSCEPLDIIPAQMYFFPVLVLINFFSGAHRGTISTLANVIADYRDFRKYPV